MGNELFMRTLPSCEICIIYSNTTAVYLRNAPNKICRNTFLFFCKWTFSDLYYNFLKVICFVLVFFTIWKSNFFSVWTLHGWVFKLPEALQLKPLSNTLLNAFKNLICRYLAAQWEITNFSCILSSKELLFAEFLIPPSLTAWLIKKIWLRLQKLAVCSELFVCNLQRRDSFYIALYAYVIDSVLCTKPSHTLFLFDFFWW